jgi:hypothetical protein
MSVLITPKTIVLLLTSFRQKNLGHNRYFVNLSQKYHELIGS